MGGPTKTNNPGFPFGLFPSALHPYLELSRVRKVCYPFERYPTSDPNSTVVDREGFHILAIWYASVLLALVSELIMGTFESLGIVVGRISY